ncbi:MAG: tyrosine-type recombinase/integrase [Campylobacterota bacterium]
MTKTNYPNIYYVINKSNKKIYYGRYKNKNGKYVKKNLGSNLRLAVSKLTSLKRNETINNNFLNEKYNISLQKALSKTTFLTAFDEYKRVVFPMLSTDEQNTRTSRFKKWILPKFGSMEINNIRYSHIQEYINELDDKNTKKEIKCSRKTQEHIKSSIQSMFTYLTKENIYTKNNTARHVTIKAYDNHVPMTLTAQQIKTFYQNIINLDVTDLEVRKKRLMLILMIHGRRLNEARNLEKCELRFLDNEYVIPAHKSKDGKTHFHKMTKFLRYELLEMTVYMKDSETYLFTNPTTNKPYRDISKFFTSIKMASNIPLTFRCQDFRHVIGTVARKQLGMPLEDIRDVLGHGTVTTTEIYSDKNSDNSRIVNNKLFDFFGLMFTDEFN